MPRPLYRGCRPPLRELGTPGGARYAWRRELGLRRGRRAWASEVRRGRWRAGRDVVEAMASFTVAPAGWAVLEADLWAECGSGLRSLSPEARSSVGADRGLLGVAGTAQCCRIRRWSLAAGSTAELKMGKADQKQAKLTFEGGKRKGGVSCSQSEETMAEEGPPRISRVDTEDRHGRLGWGKFVPINCYMIC
ncbi:hypothetical protein NDU88_002032 [Pleurodeles waltl]|uniref:Uncharacterized protein n=1 Tax=Pleurodeles waltl TaxID=8319 RepID=A0AAV7KV03_PLEWA|nr:hypothetical protein NDU88_002032 [Pleurodeles waltl]